MPRVSITPSAFGAMGVSVSKPHQQTYHHHHHASSASLASRLTVNESNLNLSGSNLARVPSGSRLDVTSQTSINTNKSAFAFAAARRLSHLFGEIFGHHQHNNNSSSNRLSASGTARVSSARSNSIPDVSSHWNDEADESHENDDDFIFQWNNTNNRINIANQLLNLNRLNGLDTYEGIARSTTNPFFPSTTATRRGSSRRGSVAATVNGGGQDDSDTALATRVCLACRRRLLYFNRKVVCCNCKDTYCQECSEKNIVGVNAGLLQQNASASGMNTSLPTAAAVSAARTLAAQFHAYPCTSNPADGVPQQAGTAGIGMNFMCKSCITLLDPQPARATLMQIRVRNLIRYLNQLEISTEFCTEKSDLVDILLQHKTERTRGVTSAGTTQQFQQNDQSLSAVGGGRLYPALFPLQTHTATAPQPHQSSTNVSPAASTSATGSASASSSPFAPVLNSNASSPLRRVASNPPGNSEVAATNILYSLYGNSSRRQSSTMQSQPVLASMTQPPLRRRSQFLSDSDVPANSANIPAPPPAIRPDYSALWRTASEQQLATAPPRRPVLPSVAIVAPPPAAIDSEDEDDEGVVNDEENATSSLSNVVVEQQRPPTDTVNAKLLYVSNRPQVFKDTLDAFMALESEEAALLAIRQLTIRQLKTALAKNLVTITGIYEKEELCQRMLVLWRTKQREKLIRIDDETDENVCKICMDAPCNSVLLNCGHMLACVECSRHLAECPACRAIVVNVVRVFRM